MPLFLHLLACHAPGPGAAIDRPPAAATDSAAVSWPQAATRPWPADEEDPLEATAGDDAAAAASPGARAPLLRFDGERPLDLLLLSIDTLQVARVRRDTAPRMMALMDGGVTLTRHRSCQNWTLPSMVCALSGQRNVGLGHVPTTLWGLPEPLPPGLETLATRLDDAGWRPRLVTANVFLEPDYGLAGGYETVTGAPEWSASRIVNRGLRLIEELSAEGLSGARDPWLVHLHFLDPHAPYDPPEALIAAPLPELAWDLTTPAGAREMIAAWGHLDRETRRAARRAMRLLYEAEIRATDAAIGALLDEAGAAGWLDEALVLLISDHGEQLFEHGTYSHGQSLYGVEADALAAFWSPGLIPARWPEPTTHVDLLPTLLDALGLPPPAETDGYVAGTAPADRAVRMVQYAGSAETRFAAQRGDAKLMYWATGQRALYDLSVDPGERDDVYRRDDPDALALWPHIQEDVAALEAMFADFEAVDPGP